MVRRGSRLRSLLVQHYGSFLKITYITEISSNSLFIVVVFLLRKFSGKFLSGAGSCSGGIVILSQCSHMLTFGIHRNHTKINECDAYVQIS
jgi:hypothetical protein